MKTRPSRQICLFARYPVPGEAKTRLIPALGSEGAAQLHRRLTEHAAAVVRTAAADAGGAVTVCFTGGRCRDFRAWLGDDFRLQKQPAGDLGARMLQAFASAFHSGASRTLAVGSDIPGLTPVLLRRAMSALDDHDIVLGPAADGGYYLLGMKCLQPALFTGMAWGTERVLAQTRAAIERLGGLQVAELPALRDVDRPEDLDSLRRDERFADVFTGAALLSVIIPTLNEEGALPTTLEHVGRGHGVEIIVADGGSQDRTRQLAAQAGATVLGPSECIRRAAEAAGCNPGATGQRVAVNRAVQQNAGAAEAKGRDLLFVHADTLLPDGYADLIRRALGRPATVAGAFRFATDLAGAGWVEWGTNVRSSLLHWPYGDQGLFMGRRIFAEMGGFAPLPIMEDFDLVRRLRRRGRIVTLPDPAITSGRRWQRLGPFRTTLRNQAMIVAFLAGIAPERLARFYRL